jgi:hypothetical protein
VSKGHARMRSKWSVRHQNSIPSLIYRSGTGQSSWSESRKALLRRHPTSAQGKSLCLIVLCEVVILFRLEYNAWQNESVGDEAPLNDDKLVGECHNGSLANTVVFGALGCCLISSHRLRLDHTICKNLRIFVSGTFTSGVIATMLTCH